ncbi:hypothetical protein QTP88_011555 [Uroleucon formosanum]
MIYNVGSVSKKHVSHIAKLNDKNEILERPTEPNHENDSVEILNRQKLSSNLKRKAIDDLYDKPSKLIHRELSNDVSTLTSYDLTLIRKNMHHARASVIPKLPNNILDLHNSLKEENIKSNQNEKFLLVNDYENNILVFSTITNLKFLGQVDTIFVDGTFKSCPKLFTQLFTIHGLSNGNYIPLVFFLLIDKNVETYKKSFFHLNSECIKNNINFLPKMLFADFEKAIHSAALFVWPSVELKGCRFHLGQSWWRKIQALGLSNEYNLNSEISNYPKIFFGLPFLKPEDVENCFTDDIVSILPQNKKVETFTDYILNTYMTPDCDFPPSLWAMYSGSIIRTTNSCEAFHSKFNGMFYSAHPNIYKFVDVLKNVQKDTCIKIRSSSQRKKIRREICEKQEFLRNQMMKYDVNEITRFDYTDTNAFNMFNCEATFISIKKWLMTNWLVCNKDKFQHCLI